MHYTSLMKQHLKHCAAATANTAVTQQQLPISVHFTATPQMQRQRQSCLAQPGRVPNWLTNMRMPKARSPSHWQRVLQAMAMPTVRLLRCCGRSEAI